MMRFLRLLPFALLFCASMLAQSTTSTGSTAAPSGTTVASDPQAVAVIQAAITAIGGATAITPLQSWTFQAQASGRIANGPVKEVLASSPPQNSGQPSGTTAKAPPPWAQPRSLFVAALISTVLVNQSQDKTFVTKQGTASASVPNATAVLFNRVTKTGQAVPAQRWYFDNTTKLPTRIDFLLPARVGLEESFPGTVMLSNWQTVGGVFYPFQIVTLLQREHAAQTITVQSVTPSTTVPTTAPSGGAQ